MQHANLAFVLVALLFTCSLVDAAVDAFDNVVDADADSSPVTLEFGTNHMIVVDAEGNGDFKTVQAAIDEIPDGNSQWIIIHVRKGVYREKVRIPHSKPYIYMRGEGRAKTTIVWDQSSLDDYESATFKVEAPHFIALGITFKNTAPTLVSHTLDTKSVAAFVGADKVAFYECGFFSNHNTLYDFRGRHYYDNCYIHGSVDFIYGHGQALFNECEVFVLKNGRVEIGGSITAHHRNDTNEESGFVFLKGSVYGIGEVYLGRPMGEHSRVLFAHTYLSRTVIPHGWSNWSYSGSTDNVYHAEYRCHGPGSDSKTRAPWAKQLRDEEAAPFLDIEFINGKEWLPTRV